MTNANPQGRTASVEGKRRTTHDRNMQRRTWSIEGLNAGAAKDTNMQRQTKNCVKVHAGGRFLRVKTCVQREKHVKIRVKTCVQHEKHVKTE